MFPGFSFCLGDEGVSKTEMPMRADKQNKTNKKTPALPLVKSKQPNKTENIRKKHSSPVKHQRKTGSNPSNASKD